ncbi:hypothetical protein HGRIS_010401 [Hohenbuehelia grisea]|uniref:Uncharacterized protein n=1 Tax=Hohenbuehelia grisea TaxID=104357 RepID=A0ABR3J4A0_9AGAR
MSIPCASAAIGVINIGALTYGTPHRDAKPRPAPASCPGSSRVWITRLSCQRCLTGWGIDHVLHASLDAILVYPVNCESLELARRLAFRRNASPTVYLLKKRAWSTSPRPRSAQPQDSGSPHLASPVDVTPTSEHRFARLPTQRSLDDHLAYQGFSQL